VLDDDDDSSHGFRNVQSPIRAAAPRPEKDKRRAVDAILLAEQHALEEQKRQDREWWRQVEAETSVAITPTTPAVVVPSVPSAPEASSANAHVVVTFRYQQVNKEQKQKKVKINKVSELLCIR
jgi:hypothetical protein